MAQINEVAFDWLDAPMVRVAAANVPVPRAEVLEDQAIPNVSTHRRRMQKGDELMAKEVFLPKLGQTVEEVTLVKWLVEDGAKVEKGQEILEVETDKAVFTVEATAKGTIHMGDFKEGEVLPVLTVVAIIGKPDEKFSPTGAEELRRSCACGPQPPKKRRRAAEYGSPGSVAGCRRQAGVRFPARPQARRRTCGRPAPDPTHRRRGDARGRA